MKKDKPQMPQGSADATVHVRRDKYRKTKPQPISKILGKEFDPANYGPHMKRGYVLSIYKRRLYKITGMAEWLDDIEDATFTGGPHPIFIVRFKTGTAWSYGLKHHAHRLKEALNKRLKSEFLKQVRFQ